MSIKLREIEVLPDGTRRLQSQLYVGRNTADFLLRPGDTMRVYANGPNGFEFVPFDGKYEIVNSDYGMITQSL